MNYKPVYILILIVALSFITINASASDTLAFGFFSNESKNDSFDYLEKILPNSFASALKNKYKFDVLKPAQIKVLTPEKNSTLKKDIVEDELPLTTEDIDADYFIYGTFKPLDNNKIQLSITIYKIGTTEVFRFEDTGYLETEFFKLVDKIAAQIKYITDDSMIYKNERVSPKSKFAIFTNLEGYELNSLYFEFLNSGYKLSPVQANELYGLMDEEQIKKFYHFSGSNASFHLISNRKDVELWHGTWSGVGYYRKIIEEKNTFEKYSFNYMKAINEQLKILKAFNSDSIDYILIIGFDDDKSNAWIRCLNVKDNKLITAETEIEGSSIDEIAKKVIKSLTTGLPDKS